MQLVKSSRDALLKPLQVVSGIVERRQTLPILANILVRKDGERVSFTATDLELQIQTAASIGAAWQPSQCPAGCALLTKVPSGVPRQPATHAAATRPHPARCAPVSPAKAVASVACVRESHRTTRPRSKDRSPAGPTADVCESS